MTKFHVVRQTAAAAITLPQSGMYLVEIRARGHATEPGLLSILYDGTHKAQFPVAPLANEVWPVNHKVPLQLPATWAIVTLGVGALVSWTFVFSDKPRADAPPISFYNAETTSQVVANSGTATTVTFPESVSPHSAVALQTLVAGATASWAPPSDGGFNGVVDSVTNQVTPPPVPLPEYDPTQTMQFTPTLAGAGSTTQLTVRY